MHIKAHKVAMLGVALAAVSAQAATLEVGAGKDYADIQTAIDAAKAGDTVLVYDGTYEIDAALAVTNAITVKSVNGADATVVVNTVTAPEKPSKDEVHRCLAISNELAVVEGFTFSDGYLYYNNKAPLPDFRKHGAGVYIHAGKLVCSTVTNCKIGRDNAGGALAMISKDAFVSNCVITANTSFSGAYGHQVLGAGAYVRAGEMVDTEISDNANICSPYPRAGGIYIGNSGDNKITFTMRRCKVVRNSCPNAQYVSEVISKPLIVHYRPLVLP